MALRRRLAYGFSGFEVPVVPRALRSARGKIPIRKTQERNPVQAFEILASVAGELLQELESSDPQVACEKDQNNIVVMEKQDEKNFLKAEPEHGFACGLPRHHAIYQVKKLSHTGNFFSFEINSISKGFDQPKTICFPDHERTARGSCFATIDGKLSCSGKFSRGHVISAIETKSIARQSILQSRWSEKLCFATKWSRFKSRNASRGPFGKVRGTSLQSGNLVRKSRVDSKELLKKPPAFVSPRSSSEYLFRGTKTSFPNYFADLARRDDDDNSLRGSQPGTIMKVHWPSPNVVHQRINNLSGSRHWRASPIMNDWKRKPVYCNGYGRSCNAKQRSLRNFPLKRRKTFKRIPISMTDGGFHYKDIFNSLSKGSSDDNNCCAVNEPSSSIGAQQAPPEPYSRACKVKYSIKSIKVPEIFIEIPSSATVGSLKRMVMEAVTTALVDGLHVGVLLQGKKVRDDSETLHQTGIPHDDKHHDSGFVLGSEPAQNTPPPSTEECGDSDQGMPGHMVSLSIQSVPADVTSLPQLMNTGGSLDNNSIAVESIDETFINDAMPDSQAQVVVPAVAMEALAVVPLQKKSKHHELVQRRTRRPFSVLEVEALVQAVEKLGTGRWRDIKLRAFDSAEHRTYVDLKDKWKTLVHTARISPQQRRGEPVPQQLLDRVLAAHAFWSEQQPQAQLKVAV